MSEKSLIEEIKAEIDVKEFVKEWALPLAVGGIFTGSIVIPPAIDAATWLVSEFWPLGAAAAGAYGLRRWRNASGTEVTGEDAFDEVFYQTLGNDSNSEGIEEELARLRAEIEALRAPARPAPARPAPTARPAPPAAAPAATARRARRAKAVKRRKMVDGRWVKKSVVELIMDSSKPHVLIDAETGGGKTTLVKHLMEARAANGHHILIVDPHNIHKAWGPHDVNVWAGGENWDDCLDVLNWLNERMRETYQRLNEGSITDSQIKPITVYLGEYNGAVQVHGKELSKLFGALATRARKAKIHLVADCQSATVKSLGMEGQGDIRRSFSRVNLSSGADGKDFSVELDGVVVPDAGAFSGWGKVDYVVEKLVPSHLYEEKARGAELSQQAGLSDSESAESEDQSTFKPDSRATSQQRDTAKTAHATSDHELNVQPAYRFSGPSYLQQLWDEIESDDDDEELSRRSQADDEELSRRSQRDDENVLTEDQLNEAVNEFVTNDTTFYKLATKFTGAKAGKKHTKARQEIQAEVKRRLTK